MRRPAIWFGVAAIIAIALAAGAAEQAQPASAVKVRVVDRTLRCTVPVHAGIRLLYANGQSGVRDQDEPSKWFALSSVSLSVSNASVAYLQAGAPRVELGTTQPQSTFWINFRVCPRPAPRVPLELGRLGGGRLSQLVERYDCTMPKRIVLRVRAEFREPVTLRSQGGGQYTEAPLAKGSFAIRSEKGKPLLYADVAEAGRARLFLAGSCVRG